MWIKTISLEFHDDNQLLSQKEFNSDSQVCGAPSDQSPGIRAGLLCLHTITPWPKEAPSRSLSACRTKFIYWCLRCPSRGMRHSQIFLQVCMSLDSSTATTIKGPCAIFWLGGMLDKSQYWNSSMQLEKTKQNKTNKKKTKITKNIYVYCAHT